MSDIKLVIKDIDWQYLEDNYDELFEKLHMDRKSKVAGFKNRKAALTSLATGLFFQEIVEEETGITPDKLIIKRNQYGKPYIEGREDFNYNISHSKDKILIGYGNQAVGVDIEDNSPGKMNKAVANRFFSDKEKEYIFRGEADINQHRFYQVWTAKEAYLKYLGTGINIPLDSFTVEYEENAASLGELSGSYRLSGRIEPGDIKLTTTSREGYIYSVIGN